MTEMRMTMTEDVTAADRQFLDERIYEYNVQATGISGGRLMLFTLRDAQDTVIAGLTGWTWGGCAAIEFLWVRDGSRHQGYGTQLLQAAEAEAMARGCGQIVLDTHDFQAPGFYTKHGYEIYSAIDDYPRGFRKYHLKKRLAEED